MNNGKIQLSKIDLNRVKKEAKSLARTDHLKHCEALNKIANKHGYKTFGSLQTAVNAAHESFSKNTDLSAASELEDILVWFRDNFTQKDNYETRVSPIIARSLENYERINGRSALPPVYIDEEVDFGYKYTPFQISRHPGALEAESILEAEGEWVSNKFLDGLHVRKGGFLGDGQDEVVGDRLTIPAVHKDEELSF